MTRARLVCRSGECSPQDKQARSRRGASESPEGKGAKKEEKNDSGNDSSGDDDDQDDYYDESALDYPLRRSDEGDKIIEEAGLTGSQKWLLDKSLACFGSEEVAWKLIEKGGAGGGIITKSLFERYAAALPPPEERDESLLNQERIHPLAEGYSSYSSGAGSANYNRPFGSRPKKRGSQSKGRDAAEHTSSMLRKQVLSPITAFLWF